MEEVGDLGAAVGMIEEAEAFGQVRGGSDGDAVRERGIERGGDMTVLPHQPGRVVRRDSQHYPEALRQAGPAALFAADEFFTARIRNPHTRRAYQRPVRLFLEWCRDQELDLRSVAPGDAAEFIDSLGSVSVQKLAIAALRQFFDVLVNRHAVMLNPFRSVRGPRRDTREGKTPEITVPQARELLDSLDSARPVGLRDRAILGTLTYTGQRVGAVARLRIQDLLDYGDRRSFAFREKRGKEREIPLRFDLDQWISEYMAAAVPVDEPKSAPLFRTTSPTAATGFTNRGVQPWTIRTLLKRRLRDAGLPEIITPHSFRVMVVTDLLSQDVPIEEVQYLAGHSHPSTTQVYDRRSRRVTRNLVERISV
ncbi:MAG: tyrosine-type recombinase/integrase [Acidobacteriota bacterium]|nr:tyrosine-type recombinase/integrase [Acidobacteriota bacterium]